VPGQRFTGTINNNLIEGVFEIEHRRYDGLGAPAFPANFGNDEALRAYLAPEAFIESDDPVLLAKALEITAGAKDSWEAACRLSRWVAQNIRYAIPGGGTARKTYDLRAGECGAHAMLLAAFCRSVGIPARVVWGCMYAPSYGGVFGQHGWNEIYMGPAGWIPVDATAGEIDLSIPHLPHQVAVTALNAADAGAGHGAQQMVEPAALNEPGLRQRSAHPATGTW
jgi:transglutaminase-like putative cysteine protease